jgi:hypothetical protein
VIDGYVLMHRKIIEWQWYKYPVHRALFQHCIFKANFKDNYLGKTLIKRGSFATSCQILADELGYTKKTILRALIDLESTKELSRETSTKGTIISITNYDSFQINVPQSTPPSTPPGKRQVSTNNKSNKSNKYKAKSFSEDLLNLFTDNEIISWLKETGSKTTHDALLSKYSHSTLKEEITKAFAWQCENKKRNAGSYLTGWLSRSDNAKKDLIRSELEELENKILNGG